MASQQELEIQRHLARYLNGETQLHEFEGWFVPVLWDLAESDDEAARELAGSVENLIAETSRGDRTLESLHKELAHIASAFASQVEQSARPFVMTKPQELTLDLGTIRKGPEISRQIEPIPMRYQSLEVAVGG